MITVYGKPGCGKCDAFKEKLLKLKLVEGVDWCSVDVTDLQKKWEAGEVKLANNARSALCMTIDEYPAIEITIGCRSVVRTYAPAMKLIKDHLKRMKNGEEDKPI